MQSMTMDKDRHSWSMTQKEKGMRETGVVMYGDERASTQQGNNHQISMTAFFPQRRGGGSDPIVKPIGFVQKQGVLKRASKNTF